MSDNEDDDLRDETPMERKRRKLLELNRQRAKLFGGEDDQLMDDDSQEKGSNDNKANNQDNKQTDDQNLEDHFNRNISLLDQHAILKKKAEEKKESERDRLIREEAEMLKSLTNDRKLMAAAELAKGVKYDKPLRTGWRPPRYIRNRDESKLLKMQKKYDINVEGDNIPPLCETFKEMKLPRVIRNHLSENKGITEPNPFQMQGLPILFSGRDMIGIASTGIGKTLVFTLPIVMFCIEQQVSMPFSDDEGPYGLILCPSRDLAEQTYKDIVGYQESIEKEINVKLNIRLCIGGVPKNDPRCSMREGCHIMVATPGRLIDNLKRRMFSLDICRYLCLDEADRLLDKFEDDLRTIFAFFKHQRQTVFFSATMPRKTQEFALGATVHPIILNVSGRAGAVNKRIKQDFIDARHRRYNLLPAINKTEPPVIIFATRPQDVDIIYEYLLERGLKVTAIYGDLHQEERSRAIDEFRSKKKDILVANDVVSKGLDFKDIKHVINCDMPSNIEDYTHRIGRTGRRGEDGLATTFITREVEPSTLQDLKGLLMEAKQLVPAFFREMTQGDDDSDADGTKTNYDGEGCGYCGGLGHRIRDCLKLEANRNKEAQAVGNRDFLANGQGDW